MTDNKKYVCLCYKQFNSRQALYSHKKKCPVIIEDANENYEELYKYYKKLCIDYVEKNTILQQHNKANLERLKVFALEINYYKKQIDGLKRIDNINS